MSCEIDDEENGCKDIHNIWKWMEDRQKSIERRQLVFNLLILVFSIWPFVSHKINIIFTRKYSGQHSVHTLVECITFSIRCHGRVEVYMKKYIIAISLTLFPYDFMEKHTQNGREFVTF